MAAYKVGGDEESRKNKNHSPLLWAGACFASFVVMVAAVRIYMTEPVCDVNNALCKRTKFALSLGTIGAFVSMVHMAVGHMFPSMIDTVVSVVMLILWAFGVSYITFGAEAPGRNLGNLYFGTWISFVLVLQASATGLRAMFLGDEDEDAAPAAAAAGGEARSPDEEKGEKDVDKQDDTQTGEEIKA
jgi:nicotinamide riboside transporter PnuC